VCRGGKEEPIAPAQLGAACLALQHLHLVTKDEDLDLAVALAARGRRTRRQRAAPCREVRRPSLHP